MTRKLFVSAIAAVLAVVAVPAYSAGSHTVLKADVPFAFAAGGAHMPAGHYLVSTTNYNGIIALENENGQKAMILPQARDTGKGNADGRLVFRQTAVGYTLTQVWMDGDSAYFSVPAGAGTSVEVQLNR